MIFLKSMLIITKISFFNFVPKLSPFWHLFLVSLNNKKPRKPLSTRLIEKLREPDLNRRPSGYEPDEWNI